jgi:hypothetical protein
MVVERICGQQVRHDCRIDTYLLSGTLKSGSSGRGFSANFF